MSLAVPMKKTLRNTKSLLGPRGPGTKRAKALVRAAIMRDVSNRNTCSSDLTKLWTAANVYPKSSSLQSGDASVSKAMELVRRRKIDSATDAFMKAAQHRRRVEADQRRFERLPTIGKKADECINDYEMSDTEPEDNGEKRNPTTTTTTSGLPVLPSMGFQ